jgi:hypothetical protein
MRTGVEIAQIHQESTQRYRFVYNESEATASNTTKEGQKYGQKNRGQTHSPT